MAATCPYCGSGVTAKEGSSMANCGFCDMKVKPAEDGQREEIKPVKQMVTTKDLNLTTRELKEWNTYNLLELLRESRKYRREFYEQFNYVKKLNDETGQMQEERETLGEEYDTITRKTFVVENLLRERMGYIPNKVTDQLLINLQDRMAQEKNFKPMIIRKPEQQQQPQPPPAEVSIDR